MSKILNCCRCKIEVGEINKGKIKTDAVVLCGKCISELTELESKIKKAYSTPAAQNVMNFFESIKSKIK